MEIQELSPRMLISVLRFERAPPAFLDRRGEIVNDLTKRLKVPDWNAGPDSLQVHTSDARRLLQLSVRDVFTSVENFDDFSEARDWARSALTTSIQALGIERISWMGTQMHWLAAADSFHELCDWFMHRYGHVGAAASGVFDRRPSDVGTVLEFKDRDPQITVRMGPMRAEQAMTQFFRDKDPTRYPDQFLFLDIDRVFPNEKLALKAALSEWDKRVANLAALGLELTRELMSINDNV